MSTTSEAKSELIDRQWQARRPNGWGTFGGEARYAQRAERKMLYDLLENNEDIIALVGGTYRAEQDTQRLHKHKGVAVATTKRILFLDKGVLGSNEVSEMPYRSAEGITYRTGLDDGRGPANSG